MGLGSTNLFTNSRPNPDSLNLHKELQTTKVYNGRKNSTHQGRVH